MIRQVTILLAFLMTISTQVNAGFYKDRTGWQSMSLQEQLGFVQGAFDEMTQTMTTDPGKTTRWKKKILDCAINMKLTAGDLMEVIDTHYSELENWQYPPNIALRQGLQKVCQVKY